MSDTSQASAAQPIATSATEPNLWPEKSLIKQHEPTELPVDILRAQAPFLSPQTDYWLKGLVRSSNLHDDVICHSFYAYAPYVRQEPFKLFYIKHGVNPWGEVSLFWGDMGTLTDCEFAKTESPGDLRARIKDLLSREELLRLIGNLVAMSKQANPASDSSTITDDESDPV